MRVPLSWLREFVDIELTPEQLAERLTLLGMEVSAIERLGSDWRRIVVGRAARGRTASQLQQAVADACPSGTG